MHSMHTRFRGFLPVVVDVETGGFEADKHALLEIAAVLIDMDDEGRIFPHQTIHCNVEPFPNSILDPKSLEVTGIVPDNPFRMAKPEREALQHIFTPVRKAIREQNCRRAVLVGHNATFDLGFLRAAVDRTQFKRDPFHPFTTLDTAALSAVSFGQTVLARAVTAAGLSWNPQEAHSAIYDAEKTAELFCEIVNRFKPLYDPQPQRDQKKSD